MGTNDDDMDDESDRGSVISAIRKTRSIDASCLDMRSIGDVVSSSAAHMPRAKSEFNLTSSTVEGKIELCKLLLNRNCTNSTTFSS